MKKVIAILASALMMAGVSANAQNLGSLLGSIASSASSGGSGSSAASGVLGALSKVIYSYTGKTDAISLPGTWTYTGAALELENSESNVLSNIAGSAASAAAESKVDGYLQKIGLSSGAMTFKFNEDLTFDCTVKGVPVSGTWTADEEAGTVKLQFGKNLKFLNLNGTLKGNSSNCEMLFNGKTFMKFAKVLLSWAAKQSSAASMVSSLAENYDNMKIGLKLRKSN